MNQSASEEDLLRRGFSMMDDDYLEEDDLYAEDEDEYGELEAGLDGFGFYQEDANGMILEEDEEEDAFYDAREEEEEEHQGSAVPAEETSPLDSDDLDYEDDLDYDDFDD